MILKKPPVEHPVIDNSGLFSEPWRQFFNNLYRRLGVVENKNYAEFSTIGTLKFNGTALINLPRESAATEPTLPIGGTKIWYDSVNLKVYLLYHDATAGQKKVELL